MGVLTLPPRSDTNLRRVAIIDDRRDSAEEIRMMLADLDVEGVVVDLIGSYTLARAVADVRAAAEELICDVQLQPLSPGVQFNGAELVATLVRDHRVPCVLITSFTDDVGMLVRPHRRWIPVLLARDQAVDPEALIEGLERCRQEIERGRGRERRTHRVPLLIEKASAMETGIALDASVGGWRSRTTMRFPASMVPEVSDLDRARELVGRVIFAKVNIDAGDDADLYLENVEARVINPTGLPLHFEDSDA